MSAPAMTARRALLRLLVRHPNQVIGHRDVVAEIGHEVGRCAVSNAARRLGRDIPIYSASGPGGGYLLRITLTTDESEASA